MARGFSWTVCCDGKGILSGRSATAWLSASVTCRPTGLLASTIHPACELLYLPGRRFWKADWHVASRFRPLRWFWCPFGGAGNGNANGRKGTQTDWTTGGDYPPGRGVRQSTWRVTSDSLMEQSRILRCVDIGSLVQSCVVTRSRWSGLFVVVLPPGRIPCSHFHAAPVADDVLVGSMIVLTAATRDCYSITAG